MSTIIVENKDGIEFLNSIDDNSVDLILTDPPYLISKDSGMNKFVEEVAKLDASGKNKKTQEEWLVFKNQKGYDDDKYRENYIKYGNTSGNKYAFKTDYGIWDKEFTIEKLEEFVKLFYKKLRKGGTCIIFFDLWKIETLKGLMEQIKQTKKKNWVGFKQIRLIEWIKTNPVPLNQSANYLTNCREVALLGVKGGKPIFHSKYDKGIYEFPIQSGKSRIHPTQKSLPLFEALIKKHSNEGDLVVDPFLGGGTTAFACKNTGRRFVGCEIDEKYVDIIKTSL
jgi:DNA modification methylase